jgi:hypothetical protein
MHLDGLRCNAPELALVSYVRSQARESVYSPRGFDRLAAKVLSGSLVLPR